MLAVMTATGTSKGIRMAFMGVSGNPEGDLLGLTKESSGSNSMRYYIHIT